MSLYALEKLNSSSFESLVKSLAIKIFGVSSQVFPSGPDAGRDFSFDGEIRGYEGRHWSGLTILQAKFKEELRGNRIDIDWLERQLDGELKKYEQNEKHPFKPKYYIIATNINLSGADSYREDMHRVGGLSRIGKALDTWKDKIGLIDYDVWSAEKIQTLLAVHEDVRRSYSVWITPSDVLNTILNTAEEQEKLLLHALKLSLCHCLKRDKNVRLKDAGSVAEDNIRSSQVFVDLPVYIPVLEEAHLLTKRLIEISKGIFKPSFVADSNQCLGNKILLLGGPGQGKSTASMFLTQLFRASLLKSDIGFRLDDLTNRVVRETFERASAEGISISLANRFPFYISLPHYADRISEARRSSEAPPSLLKYIAIELVGLSDADISIANMRKWLSELPWIIVLDGLDEVPPTGERARVVEEIERLVLEAENLDGDVFFVATSRPQGYNSDLDPDSWESWRLSSLDSDTAIRYAKLLTSAYYKDDPDRQLRINNQLEASFNNDVTSNLVSTPLQVTILNLIVDIGGGIPTSRWNLFNEYFEILKRRERSKPGQAQEALVRNSQFIGPIHQRAGLVLHIAAESAGAATSHLDQNRFNELIKNYLKSEDFDDSEIESRSDELSALALNRLVLLSSREEGRVSFDVRSLQEYMAASALTSADPLTICDRLEYLAGKSHWQHVVTIAASRCFSEDNFHYSRSAITNIPRRLDQISHYKVTGRGAKLSLELLIDGIAVDQPKYRKDLAVHAMELLNIGEKSFDYPLERVSDSHTVGLLHDELNTKYLCSHDPAVRAAAWKLLDKLALNGDRKAIYQASTRWPTDPGDIFEIIKYGVFPSTAPLTKESAYSAVLTTSVSEILAAGYLASTRAHSEKYEPHENHVKEVVHLINFLSSGVVEVPAWMSGLECTASYVPISHMSVVEVPKLPILLHPEWSFIFSCVEFSKSPSIETLVECIESYPVLGERRNRDNLLSMVPWVISSILKEGGSSEELILKARQGLYGDERIWAAAEGRIQKDGVTEDDLEFSSGREQFDVQVERIGTLGAMSVGAFSVIKSANNVAKCIKALSLAKFDSSRKVISKAIAMSINFASMSELERSLLLEAWGVAQAEEISRYSYLVASHLTEPLITEGRICELSELWENSFLLRHTSETYVFSDDVIDKICAYLIMDEKLSGLVVSVFYHVLINGRSAPVSSETLRRLARSSSYKISVAALAILFARDYSVEDVLVEEVVNGFKSSEDWHYFYNFFESVSSSQGIDHSVRTSILTKLAIEIEALSLEKTRFNIFRMILERHLDSEKSDLSVPGVWARLKLPVDALTSIQ